MAQIGAGKLRWSLPEAAGQAPPKRYRIGELARFTGLTRQTLHNYTRWGLIKETEWTPGGHRLYDEAVFTRLSKILRLRKEHTVEEMKALLDPCTANADRSAAKPCDQKGAADR